MYFVLVPTWRKKITNKNTKKRIKDCNTEKLKFRTRVKFILVYKATNGGEKKEKTKHKEKKKKKVNTREARISKSSIFETKEINAFTTQIIKIITNHISARKKRKIPKNKRFLIENETFNSNSFFRESFINEVSFYFINKNRFLKGTKL